MDGRKNVVKAKVVFVSWSSAQRDIKNQICDYLNEHLTAKNGGEGPLFEDKVDAAKRHNISAEDIKKCFDSDSHCYGDIAEACKSGVMLSTVFLVICTDAAVKSEWVMFEIDCAKQALSRNYIVPVYLTELLSAESSKVVKDLASGIEVEHLTELISGGNKTLGLRDDDLRVVFNKVQVALNEHIYSDYLISQIKNLDATVIKDYGDGSCGRYDFKSLYVERNIYREQKGGVDAENNITEHMLVEESNSAPIIVYGGAGCGKSMLINKIVFDIYENLSGNAAKEGNAENPLVFKVPLRELKDKPLTLYLFEKFTSAGRYGGYTEEDFKYLLKSRNSNGGIRIFFDAIDEVISPDQRNFIITDINNFCSVYGKCKLVFTSRSKDSEFVLNATKNLNVDYKAFRLEQFDGGQSAKYIDNIFAQLAQNGTLNRGRCAQEFTSAIANINNQIKSNPFILTQLIFMYNNGGAQSLPKTLASICEKTMDRYIRRERDITLNADIAAYEDILAQAAYSKYIFREDSFYTIFKRIRVPVQSADNVYTLQPADKVYTFFKERSVIDDRAFFYQIFNDYYAAKYIFMRSIPFDGRSYEVCDDKKFLTGLKEDLAAGTGWDVACRIFLSMVEDNCKMDVFTQVIMLLAGEESNCSLLFDIAANVLTKYKSDAQYALINGILQRTADGEFGWYDQLCYYVPVYNLYAPLAAAVSAYNGANKRRALCVLRDICFIYGALDGVEEIENLPARTAEDLRRQCREIYKDDIALLKAGKPFDARAALNVTFYLGIQFAAERQFYGKAECKNADISEDSNLQENTADYDGLFSILKELGGNALAEEFEMLAKMAGYKDDAAEDQPADGGYEVTNPEYIIFDGEKYPAEYIVNNFVAVYPREFCVLHAINRRSEAEAGRPEKILFTDSENLFNPVSFKESGHIGLRFVPYDTDKITANFTEEKADRLTGLILLPSDEDELEYYEFNKENLYYYSFPDNITRLNQYCFNFCRNITYLFITGNVEHIDENCFDYSPALYLYLESSQRWGSIHGTDNLGGPINKIKCSSLTQIGSLAFYNCHRLTDIKLPCSVTEIADGAFENCVNLQYILLPDGMTEIGEEAFKNCGKLALDKLPEGITEIGQGAFENCKLLALDCLPHGIKTVSESTFNGCSSLKITKLPDNLSYIADYAFGGCTALKLKELPENLYGVGYDAFSGCADCVQQLGKDWHAKMSAGFMAAPDITPPDFDPLEGFSVPDSFMGAGIAMITVGANYSNISSVDVDEIISYNNLTRETVAWVLLSENLREIGSFAFDGCTALERCDLPDGIKVIGSNAFENCTSLDLGSLPEGAVINSAAFRGCSRLNFSHLPDCTRIRDDVFKGCSSLDLEELPPSLVVIDVGAFEGCGSLKLKSLPDGLQLIDSNAFKDCGSLALEVLPKNAEIRSGAFNGCSSLKLEMLPQCKVIGAYTFKGCTSLDLKELPDTLEEIGGCAFEDCVSLKLTRLPKSIATINGSAFKGCTSLILSQPLPDYMDEYISPSAFEGCNSLILPRLPKCIRYIRERAFYGCASLAIDKLPPYLEQIGDYAFCGCSSITEMTIPKSVMLIGDNAFAGCALKKVALPKNFERDISRIFGDIDKNIITFI